MSNPEIRRQLSMDAGERPQEFRITRTGIYADDEDALHRIMYDLTCKKAQKLVTADGAQFPAKNQGM